MCLFQNEDALAGGLGGRAVCGPGAGRRVADAQRSLARPVQPRAAVQRCELFSFSFPCFFFLFFSLSRFFFKKKKKNVFFSTSFCFRRFVFAMSVAV